MKLHSFNRQMQISLSVVVGDRRHVLRSPEDACCDNAERGDNDERKEKAEATGETAEKRIGRAFDAFLVHTYLGSWL